MKFITNKHIARFGCLIAVDGVLFNLTNARSASSFVLITAFIMLAATFYYLIYALLAFVRLYGVSVRNKKRLATYLTALISSLIALQSIGELNGRDVLVLLPLLLIGYTYSLYARTSRGVQRT